MDFKDNNNIRDKLIGAYGSTMATKEQKAQIANNIKAQLLGNKNQKIAETPNRSWFSLHKKLAVFTSILLVFLSITGVLLFLDWDKDNDNNSIPSSYSGGQYQTVNDADKYISFEVRSIVELSDLEIEKSIIIKNYLGDLLSLNLSKSQDIYTINPPINGYDEGVTYDIAIDITKVNFVAQEISLIDKVGFTIKRPEVINAVYNEAVVDIYNTVPIIVDDIDMSAVIDGANYSNGDIIIINVDDGGFIMRKAYKITNIIDVIDNQ